MHKIITMGAVLLVGALSLTGCGESPDGPLGLEPIVRIELAAGGCGSLRVGEECQLTVTVFGEQGPMEADPLRIRWQSLNPTIATVDFEGVVTGAREGDAVITVATINGLVTDQVSLRVGEAPPRPPEPGDP